MQKSTFIQMFKAPTLIEEDFFNLKKVYKYEIEQCNYNNTHRNN